MAIVNGWLDWAVKVPGPVEKQYAQQNSAMGYVPHSAVGFYAGWASRLFDMSKLPSGRFTPNAAASVHGWIAYDGTVTQHYPFTSSCWASGNFHANTNFIAFENEGGPPGDVNQPLTVHQISANTRIIQEISVWKSWTPVRPNNVGDKTATLYEHNECVRLWGGSPTACPSARIPWDVMLKAFELEDDLTTYKLFQTWGPPKLWNIQYCADVPMWRRWITTRAGADRLISELGEPENISLWELHTIPEIKPSA